MKRIAIVIPAYNAADTISRLCRQLVDRQPNATIIVVDDGSNDATALRVRETGTTLLQHARNRGKGEALKSGFDYVSRNGFDAVVTIDADLQHDPDEIPKLVKAANNDHTVVVGVRRLDPAMPFARKVSNSISSLVASIFSTVRLKDSQSGFRYIPVSLLREIELKSSRYDLEPELLIRAARAGYSINSVAVRTIYNASQSFINPLADLYRFLKMITKSLFW